MEKQRSAGTVDLANAYDELGYVYLALGRPRSALATFSRSRELRERELGQSPTAVASSLDGLASAYADMGDLDRAEDLFEEALDLRCDGSVSDPVGEAQSMHNLGSLHLAMGRLSTAERELFEAVQLWQAANRATHPSTAKTLASLASFYFAVGRDRDAQELLEASLRIQRVTIGTEAPLAFRTMSNLAYAYVEVGEHGRARALHDELLRAYRDLSDDQLAWLFAGTAGGIPVPWLAMSRSDLSRRVKRAASILENKLGPSHPSVAWAYLYLAWVNDLAGRREEAAEHFARALAVGATSSYPALRTSTLYRFAVFEYEGGDRETAIFFGKQAVNAWQAVVVSAASLGPLARDSFRRDSRSLFEDVANWLIEAGRLAEATEVIAILKEMELRSYTNQGAKRDGTRQLEVETTRVERRAGKDYREKLKRIADLAREYDDARWRFQSDRLIGKVPTPEREVELETLRTVLASAQIEFRNEVEKVKADLRKSDRSQVLESGKLSSLRTLQSSLRRLGHGSVVLHYLVMKERLHILLTAPTFQLAKTVPVARNRLREAAFRTVAAVRDVGQDPRPSASELYDLVFAPISAELRAFGARTLMISLDDVLRYVPWAALYDRETREFLIEEFAIAIYAESGRNMLERKRSDDPEAAGLGLTIAVGGYPRLPAVEAELEAVVKQDDSDPDGAMKGKIFLNEDFDSSLMINVLESGYQVVHIASHFEFRPGSDRDSFLLLGDGTHLRVSEIRERNFPFDDVDLITFSACETALGSESDGREVEGLAGVAQSQGAAAVVATLWSVFDPSTADIMRCFYEEMTGPEKRTKAEALRRAMLSLLQRRSDLRGLNHPYYWAPFILLGNWL